MVRRSSALLLLAFLLCSCSMMQSGSDYLFAPSVGGEPAPSIWPVRGMPELLDTAQADLTMNASDNSGKSVQFLMAQEYISAANERCRKYYVDLTLNLACYRDNWYPVRVF